MTNRNIKIFKIILSLIIIFSLFSCKNTKYKIPDISFDDLYFFEETRFSINELIPDDVLKEVIIERSVKIIPSNIPINNYFKVVMGDTYSINITLTNKNNHKDVKVISFYIYTTPIDIPDITILDINIKGDILFDINQVLKDYSYDTLDISYSVKSIVDNVNIRTENGIFYAKKNNKYKITLYVFDRLLKKETSFYIETY
jgi:hypothetical protein